MAAHVEYSNFSSGYAWAKCRDCDWKGTKYVGAGKLSNRLARDEAAKHDAEAHTEPEECEHGLSAWLCAGPMHYPADRESFF